MTTSAASGNNKTAKVRKCFHRSSFLEKNEKIVETISSPTKNTH
jgi:hypothetical protein